MTIDKTEVDEPVVGQIQTSASTVDSQSNVSQSPEVTTVVVDEVIQTTEVAVEESTTQVVPSTLSEETLATEKAIEDDGGFVTTEATVFEAGEGLTTEAVTELFEQVGTEPNVL